MNNKILFKIAIKHLKHHKGRSLLTILGIVVGISAIIATLAIGYGAEVKLKQKILSLGRNYIFVHAGRIGDEGKTAFTKRKSSAITETDVKIFKYQCKDIKNITPVIFTRQLISFNGTNIFAEIKCGNQDYLKIVNRKIKSGHFFSKKEIQKNSRVIVIGSQTAKELFHQMNPIGKAVQIQNILYTIIGVATKIENYMGTRDPNLDCFLPISTAKKYILHTNDFKVHGIAISAKNKKDMPKIVKTIKKILRFEHRLEMNEPDDFTIYDQQEMEKAAQHSANILQILLTIIASISLLVGGIGVMNIMLVSVSERTQEIGIRMALGAADKIILRQFIIEAIVLCFVGGIIGIILGLILPIIVSIFTGWIIIYKLHTIIFAFAITFIIGLIFGYYPAKMASQLNPVDALQEK